MGYEINTEAYKHLLQIEIGIREFLINLIKKNNLKKWHESFIGKNQRESLHSIITRINEEIKNDREPNVADQYIYKSNRGLRERLKSYKSGNIKHPFYYLNWNDMENLLGMKFNSELIEKELGKSNKEEILNSLNSITILRNDIAHSRFITHDEFNLIKASHTKISSLIPDFNNYLKYQSQEDIPKIMLTKVCETINLYLSNGMLKEDEINKSQEIFEKCINSFWLNNLNKEALDDIYILKEKMNLYEKYRNQPGGLLQIENWKNINKKLITDFILKYE